MKNIVIVVIVLALAGLFGYAAMQPAVFKVERSVLIKASPEKIKPLINDFHNWPAWSPYEKMAPVTKRDYTGPSAGKGAIYSWESSNGWAGKMAIEESSPETVVVLSVAEKPMKMENKTMFTLNKKDNDSTEVVMSLSMKNSYLSKLMGIFMNRDKLMGKAFEIGLTSLKAEAEKAPAVAPAPASKAKKK